MKVRLVTDGGFGCPDIVGKVVEAEANYYIPHSELCRVSNEWVKLTDGNVGVTGPDYLWCFTREEVEVLNG